MERALSISGELSMEQRGILDDRRTNMSSTISSSNVLISSSALYPNWGSRFLITFEKKTRSIMDITIQYNFAMVDLFSDPRKDSTRTLKTIRKREEMMYIDFHSKLVPPQLSCI